MGCQWGLPYSKAIIPCFQRERDPTAIPNPFKKPPYYEYHTAICKNTPKGKEYWICKDKPQPSDKLRCPGR